MQTPLIITFANYKGGVGKSTLCAYFAHFLSCKDIKIKVVDCDPQLSLYQTRERELSLYPERKPQYQVEKHIVSAPMQTLELIENLYKQPEYDIILIDCPGKKEENWYRPLLLNTDIAIIPFHFDKLTILSTTEFLKDIESINQTLRADRKIETILIPNQVDKRVGTATELKMWEQTRQAFSKVAKVTSLIPVKADMTRVTTLLDVPKQMQIADEAFQEIYSEIYDDPQKSWNK